MSIVPADEALVSINDRCVVAGERLPSIPALRSGFDDKEPPVVAIFLDGRPGGCALAVPSRFSHDICNLTLTVSVAAHLPRTALLGSVSPSETPDFVDVRLVDYSGDILEQARPLTSYDAAFEEVYAEGWFDAMGAWPAVRALCDAYLDWVTAAEGVEVEDEESAAAVLEAAEGGCSAYATAEETGGHGRPRAATTKRSADPRGGGRGSTGRITMVQLRDLLQGMDGRLRSLQSERP